MGNYNYGYLCIICFSLSSVVKRFEFLKVLSKFPIIIMFTWGHSEDSEEKLFLPAATAVS